jgi:glycosyltransferase involved in cell wall biosynthesis
VEVNTARLAVDARCLTGRRTGIATWLAGALAAADQRELVLYVKSGTVADFPDAQVRRIRRGFHARVAWQVFRARMRYLSPDSLIVPTLLGQAATAVVHDLAPLARPETQTRRTQLAYRALLRAAARRVGSIVVPSEATRHELIRFAPHAANIHVVAEAARTMPNAGPTPKGQPPDVRPPFILFTGTIEPRKNVPVLVEAFRRAAPADWQLVIAGGWGWVPENVRRELEAAAADTEVQLLGYVDDLTLAALYRDAEIFIYPSSYEGFGLPVLEAMAAGVPVITTDTPALRELADGHARLASLSDLCADLTRLMRELCNDPAVRGQLRAEGREHAAAFDWKRSSQQIMRVALQSDPGAD